MRGDLNGHGSDFGIFLKASSRRFTHHDTNTHAHVLAQEPEVVGHVDFLTVPPEPRSTYRFTKGLPKACTAHLSAWPALQPWVLGQTLRPLWRWAQKTVDQWGRAQGQTPALAFLAGLGTDILTLGRIDEPKMFSCRLFIDLAAITHTASLAEKSSWVNTGSVVRLCCTWTGKVWAHCFSLCDWCAAKCLHLLLLQVVIGRGVLVF